MERIRVFTMSFGGSRRRRRESGLVETWTRVSCDATEDMAMQVCFAYGSGPWIYLLCSDLLVQIFVRDMFKVSFRHHGIDNEYVCGFARTFLCVFIVGWALVMKHVFRVALIMFWECFSARCHHFSVMLEVLEMSHDWSN